MAEVRESVKRAPGRPREFNREQALRAAMLLFWRQGFDGTSYTELTAATGMSKPTLYATFGDKVALFREAMLAYAEQATLLYKEALERTTAREAVEACLKLARGLRAHSEEPGVCFLVQGALTGGADTQHLRDELKAMQRQATQLLRKRLEQGKRKGELPAGISPSALAEYFHAVMSGVSVQAVNGASLDDLNEVIDIAMATWSAKVEAHT